MAEASDREHRIRAQSRVAAVKTQSGLDANRSETIARGNEFGAAPLANSAIIPRQVLNTEKFIQGAFVNHQNLVQPLEPRRLLAASFASLSSHGTLSIIGTAKNDTITISISPTNGRIVAKLNSASMSFAKSSVKRIWADAVHGNDHIENDTALPSTLLGSSGDDTLRGGSGDDSLDGGGGNDLLRPGDGNNSGTLDVASDSLDYRDATSGSFGIGDDTSPPLPAQLYVNHGSFSDTFTITSFEHHRLNFTATPRNDDIGGALDFDAVIHGGSGNDSLNVNSGYSDSSISLYGDAGNDSLSADGEDVFVDFGDGGPGDDSYHVYNAHDWNGPFIDTGGGHDQIEIGLPSDALNATTSDHASLTVPAGIEDARIVADGEYGIHLAGNSLNNNLYVEGADNDHVTINGGTGNDTLSANAGPETLIGGDGNDSLVGGYGKDLLHGDAGNDVLYGGLSNDTLDGGPGRDKLYGQDGNDTIYAKDGRTDTLDGGAEFDTAQRDNSATIKDQVLNTEKFI